MPKIAELSPIQVVKSKLNHLQQNAINAGVRNPLIDIIAELAECVELLEYQHNDHKNSYHPQPRKREIK